MKKIDLKSIKFQKISIEDLKQKVKNMKRHKCCLIIAGVIMSLIGFYSMFHPAQALLSLALLLGFGFVISGINHIFAIREHKNDTVDHPEWFMAQGVFEIILGFIMLANIGVTALSIPVMVAFWAMFDGVMKTTAAFRLKKAGIEKWWLLNSSGIISILFALFLLARPFAGVITVTFLLGLTLLLWGITAVLEALNFYD